MTRPGARAEHGFLRRVPFLVLTVAVSATAACTPPPAQPQSPVVSSFEALGAPHLDPALLPFRWSVSDPQGDAITCRLDGDGDGTWDHTLDPCAPDASRNVPASGVGTHTARFEVSDGTNNTEATATYDVVAPESYEGFDVEIRPSGPVDADVVAAFEWAASRWEDSIARGLSDMAVTVGAGSCGANSSGIDEVVDDLVVEISTSTETFASAAWGAPCVFGPDSLPRYGFAEMNWQTLPDVRYLGILEEVALHEVGHVLGFGVVWQFNRDLVADADGTDPRFVGPRALAEGSALGRSGDIPVGTINGVRQPHWESALLGAEIMSSLPDGSPLSRLTIASMADLGYAVDLDAADPYSPPLPAGTCVGFGGGVFRCW